MTEPEDEITEGEQEESLCDFDPNQLDLRELEKSDEIPADAFTLTGKVPPFLARLQWWGFGVLVAFILLVLLRMIFGPPWIDRFRYSRPPVTIANNKGQIGTIVPAGRDYVLYLIDNTGRVMTSRVIGPVSLGPVDLSMGKSYYYYVFDGGSWVAVRQYGLQEMDQKYDIDLNQFQLKIRDGIDLITSKDGDEYLNVYTEDKILTLQLKDTIWSLYNSYQTGSWNSADEIRLLDLSANHAIAEEGSTLMLLDFTNFIDSYKKYNEASYLKDIPQRPLFPMEFLYKPAIIVPARESTNYIDYLVLRNDRMFNLPYKYGDDQVLMKRIGKTDLEPLHHPFFEKKDIRGITVIENPNETLPRYIEFAVLYEIKDKYHVAGLRFNDSEAVWDMELIPIAQPK